MPSPLRSPKTLSEWFELDYFRRRRLFRGLRRSLIGVAFLASCLTVGWTLLPGKQTVYQAGPLSTAHALFNQDCGKCHTEAFPTLKRLWTSDAAVRSVPDSACQQCHSGARHHDCVAPRNCASCHHEHRGQTALARVTDDQCTFCHADLKCDNGRAISFAPHITAFLEGRHPEFRLWREGEPADPGTVRFNHKLHLEAMLDIDHEQRKLQRQKLQEIGGAPCAGELPKKQVRLACRSCHEMDAAGRYMQPISFDRHCKECHPLSVQLVGDWKPPLRERACAFSTSPAPHPAAGETAEAVRAALRERLTRFILNPDNKAFLTDPKPVQPARPIPGWGRIEPVSPREYAWVNRQLEQIEWVLFDGGGGCRHCHQETTIMARRPGGLPDYRPPGLRGVEKPWYEHSVFSHNSHKALDCAQCHAGVEASEKASDVLMPRLATCRQCHNTQDRASARADCVACHLYHNLEEKRQFQGRLTIQQFQSK
jgi:hypothetical protein